MKIKSFFIFPLLIFCFFSTKSYSQDNHHFQLSGLLLDSTIKKIEILYIQKEKNFLVNEKIVTPTDSVFIFEGLTPYPYAVYLRFNDTVRSKLFFIDKGREQVIVKNIDSPLFIYNSKINEEYQNNYLPLIKEIETNYDHDIAKLRLKYNFEVEAQAVTFKEKLLIRLDHLRLEKKRIIIDYIDSSSNSYVGLWMLYFDTQYFGYNKIYENVDEKLGMDLLSNSIGKEITKTLKISAELKAAGKFSVMQSLISLKNNYNFEFKKKYTLVDFWFSHCGPCIAQFPALKQLYAEHPDELSIFSISIDDDPVLWKNTIRFHKLKWPQFLDKAGLNAKRLIINKYPTNYLVDEKGVIIEKDISLNKLKKLLEHKN